MAAFDYLTDVQELKDLPPSLRAARDYWDRIRGDRPFPERADIDPVDIPGLLPHLELIDVLPPTGDGVPDFRYRLIGTGVDDISLRRNAGRRVSEIPHQRAPSQLHSMLCLVIIRREPVYVRLPYVGDDPLLEAVDNFVAPLSQDGAEIDMLLSVIAPLWRQTPPQRTRHRP